MSNDLGPLAEGAAAQIVGGLSDVKVSANEFVATQVGQEVTFTRGAC
jgi:hypothetical protein